MWLLFKKIKIAFFKEILRSLLLAVCWLCWPVFLASAQFGLPDASYYEEGGIREKEGEQEEEVRKVEKIVYTGEELRDPFQSPFEMVEPPPKKKLPSKAGLSHLQVQGMVWGTEMPQAIINDTVVRVGEIIGGAEILDIRKEGVRVLYEEEEYILKPATPRRRR